MKSSIITILTLVLCISTLVANDGLGDKLKDISEQNVKGYLQPLVNTVGAGLNAGFFTSAKTLPTFMPNIRINMVGVSVPSGDKKFIAMSPDDELWENVETATVLGNKGKRFPTVDGNDIPSFTLPDGADLSLIPVPAVTASLGLPLGSEISVKFLPSVEISKDLGSVSMWGVGLKHSIDQYLTDYFPVHIAIQGVYQSMKLTDFVDVKTFTMNIHTSKKIFILTLYGGIGIESADFDVKYTYHEKVAEGDTGTDITIKKSLSAENDVKLTLGGKLSPLPFVAIFADYNIANYNSFNVGLEIGF